jgi:hypothetical protein
MPVPILSQSIFSDPGLVVTPSLLLPEFSSKRKRKGYLQLYYKMAEHESMNTSGGPEYPKEMTDKAFRVCFVKRSFVETKGSIQSAVELGAPTVQSQTDGWKNFEWNEIREWDVST